MKSESSDEECSDFDEVECDGMPDFEEAVSEKKSQKDLKNFKKMKYVQYKSKQATSIPLSKNKKEKSSLFGNAMGAVSSLFGSKSSPKSSDTIPDMPMCGKSNASPATRKKKVRIDEIHENLVDLAEFNGGWKNSKDIWELLCLYSDKISKSEVEKVRLEKNLLLSIVSIRKSYCVYLDKTT